MIPALTIAVAGLIDATNRANQAAENTVRRSAAETKFSTDAAASYGRASSGTAATPGGAGSTSRLGGTPRGTPVYIPSMAEDVVMMREAVSAYRANAQVIRKLDQVTRELIDIVKPDKNTDTCA